MRLKRCWGGERRARIGTGFVFGAVAGRVVVAARGGGVCGASWGSDSRLGEEGGEERMAEQSC